MSIEVIAAVVQLLPVFFLAGIVANAQLWRSSGRSKRSRRRARLNNIFSAYMLFSAVFTEVVFLVFLNIGKDAEGSWAVVLWFLTVTWIAGMTLDIASSVPPVQSDEPA